MRLLSIHSNTGNDFGLYAANNMLGEAENLFVGIYYLQQKYGL